MGDTVATEEEGGADGPAVFLGETVTPPPPPPLLPITTPPGGGARGREEPWWEEEAGPLAGLLPVGVVWKQLRFIVMQFNPNLKSFCQKLKIPTNFYNFNTQVFILTKNQQ